MNFLSHYYFERFAIDPEQVLGGLLPDLLKNADKRYSFQLHKYGESLMSSGKAQAITTGWLRHNEIDRLFHNSDYFFRHTHQLRLELEKDINDLPIRPSFLAHIALELLLDHQLIAHELLNVERLYEHLEQIDRTVVTKYLNTLGGIDVDYFFVFYDKFVASRYIFDYEKVDNLPYALFNICKRVWKFSPKTEHLKTLAITLETYKNEKMMDFFEIYSDLNQKLD